jgi:hypothetical protein
MMVYRLMIVNKPLDQAFFAVLVDEILLANYLMLRLLLDRFVAPSRIIITGSGSHFAGHCGRMGGVRGRRRSATDVSSES